LWGGGETHWKQIASTPRKLDRLKHTHDVGNKNFQTGKSYVTWGEREEALDGRWEKEPQIHGSGMTRSKKKEKRRGHGGKNPK